MYKLKFLFTLILLVLLSTSSYAQSEEKGKPFVLGVEFNGGAFGLFNVDNEFTKADPTIGGTLTAEWGISPIFYLGGEYLFIFAKSQLATEPRLIMSPHVRGRFEFEVHPKINVDLIAAGGLCIWPENDNEILLSPALTDTRLGWSVRFAAGLNCIVASKTFLYANFGYAAFSSGGNDVWVTHDSMLISLGLRYHLR